MSITDLIKNLREQKLTDDQIVQEIIRKYPEKEKAFNEAYKRNVTSGQIIEEIIRQNPPGTPVAQEKPDVIEEAKKRIELLKKEGIKPTEPTLKEEEGPGQDFEPKTKEEILDEFLKRKAASQEETKTLKTTEELEEKIQTPEEIIKPLPKRKGAFKRFLLRFLIVSFILIILGLIVFFWYWYFFRKAPTTECSNDSDCQEGYICSNSICEKAPTKCSLDKECLKNYFCDNGICKKIQTPISEPFFEVENTAVLEISSLEEIKNLLPKKANDWVDADTFKRIVFVNKTNNEEVDLKEFFEAITAKAPAGFFSNLENNFTFFIYSQIQGNRVGFVAKIKNPGGLPSILKAMEPKLESDFGPFYTLISKEEKYGKAVFKDAIAVKSYTGPNFRYKILGSHDSGIYYLASDKNYFIFTTSWKSMEKIITKLGIAANNP